MGIQGFISWVRKFSVGNKKIKEYDLITYFSRYMRVGINERKFIFWVIRESAGRKQISEKKLDEILNELGLNLDSD